MRLRKRQNSPRIESEAIEEDANRSTFWGHGPFQVFLLFQGLKAEMKMAKMIVAT